MGGPADDVHAEGERALFHAVANGGAGFEEALARAGLGADPFRDVRVFRMNRGAAGAAAAEDDGV
jgi:hypothetical protein